jgi:hypothetical protein
MDTPLDIEKKLPAHVPNRAGNEQPISDYALEQDRLLSSLVGSQKVADGDYRECRRPEISRSAKQLFRCEARKLVATMRGIFGKIRLATR